MVTKVLEAEQYDIDKSVLYIHGPGTGHEIKALCKYMDLAFYELRTHIGLSARTLLLKVISQGCTGS